jgi:hypothetical protein
LIKGVAHERPLKSLNTNRKQALCRQKRLRFRSLSISGRALR